MNVNTLPVFYSFRRCPYAMRARMAVYIAKINVKFIEVSLKNKPQELLDYSPKGTVPVVITPTNEVIEESRDIMYWALQQSDPHNWLLQGDAAKHAYMMRLVDECDQQFKPLLDRYKYFDRYPEHSQNYYREKAEVFLQKLNNILDQQEFLVDQQLRFADVGIFPFIRQFAGVDTTWFYQSPYKHVQRWLDTCTNTKMFNAIMEKPLNHE